MMEISETLIQSDGTVIFEQLDPIFQVFRDYALHSPTRNFELLTDFD
jgi:hypothetical protein